MLVLAIAGVIALVLASRAIARPLTAISAISPAMNFAYVRVAGAVIDYPSLSLADGYMSFEVQDASGLIRVTAYRAVLDKLVAIGRIPMPGSRVTVEGTLRVREDEPSLTLNAAEALALDAAPVQVIALSALGAMRPGDRAATIAQVRRVRDAGSGLRIISLRAGSAEADLLIPLNLRNIFGESPAVSVGDWISVTGAVAEYRGKRELLANSAQEIVAAPPMEYDLRPLAAINKNMTGQWVAVRGIVNKLRPMKTGILLDLKDNAGGAITVAMFDAWFNVPFSRTLRVGDGIVAQGTLVDYYGQLELQPEQSVDLIQYQ
ncbi:MAG: hypothetical protein M1434_13845 [Chloroflexi bacterium]|nr:hypothetical protein [Chloroflexota bacterium]